MTTAQSPMKISTITVRCFMRRRQTASNDSSGRSPVRSGSSADGRAPTRRAKRERRGFMASAGLSDERGRRGWRRGRVFALNHDRLGNRRRFEPELTFGARLDVLRRALRLEVQPELPVDHLIARAFDLEVF